MISPKIYISHFQQAFVVESESLTPIQVGAALSPVRLDMLGDDTGNNISDDNPLYCELTSHYWAWKNDSESTHFGFFHYRRFLDLKGHKEHPKDSPHGIIEDDLGSEKLAEYGLDDETISNVVGRADLIVPRPYNVRSAGFRTVEQHYRGSPDHRGKDFQVARKVVAEISPEYSKAFEKMAGGSLLYPANIFIATRELFESYASWIFPVLNAIRLAVDSTGYNSSEMRYIGYLAERLTTTFILKQLEELPKERLTVVPLLFVQDVRPLPGSPPLPTTDLPVVSVVASSDEAYAPHLAGLISSTFRNASHDHFIDFIVLGDRLSNTTQKELRHLERQHPHCRVSFVTMDRMFSKLKVHTYFAKSTFNRLGIAEILSDRSKVLFLDTDMIVLGDVAELFGTDLQGKLIGACRDMVMLAFRALGVSAMVEAGGMPAKVYLSNRLGMRGREDEYFQGGTILMDLDAIRGTSIFEDMVDDLANRVFWFLDQDVMNKHLVGQVHFLDNKWNALYLDERHTNSLPAIELKLHMKANENPAVIHFAGPAKPWLNDLHPMGNYYWYFMRDTFWYESTLMKRMASATGKDGALVSETSGTRRLMSKMWRLIPTPVRPAFGPLARYLVRIIR